MPELPEVETVKNGLIPFLEGQKICTLWQSHQAMHGKKHPPLLSPLVGTRIIRIQRRAKYLLFETDSNIHLMLHLGMSGACRIEKKSKPPLKHTHLVLGIKDGAEMHYYDPRRFGWFNLVHQDEVDALFHKLGVEPLSNGFNGAYLAEKFQKRTGAIKNILLNQSLVAGLGNIYVCEALWKASIHPETPAQAIAIADLEKLAMAIKSTLIAAIESGGSSLKDHLQVNGEMGYFQHQFHAYGKAGEDCDFRDPITQKLCGGKITKMVQAGRSSFFCGHHQQ